MKKILLLTALCALGAGCTGDLLRRAPKMPAANAHPKADAVILMHRVRMEIDPKQGALSLDVHRHLWLRTAKACARHGRRIVLPYPKSASLQAFQARLLRPKEASVRSELSLDFPSQQFGSPHFYDDENTKVLFLSGATPGSVLDYRYRLVLKLPAHGHVQRLQDLRYPVLDAHVTLSYPQSFVLRHRLLSGFKAPASGVRFRKQSAQGKVTLSWRARRLPPVELETQMPHWRRLLLRLELAFGRYSHGRFQGRGESWRSYGRFFSKLIGSRTKATEKVKQLAQRLTRNAKTQSQKIRALYRFARGRIRYLYVGLGLGGYQPQSLERTLRFRYGDCKAKAALLIAMLRALGIPALPVLVRTRDYGPLSASFPRSGFNHMIAFLPEFQGGTYVDPTASHNPLEQLRWDDQGASALLLQGDKSRFVTLPFVSARRNLLHRTWVLTRKAKGQVHGTVLIRQRGFWAISDRGRLKQGDYSSPQRRIGWLRPRLPSWLSHRISGLRVSAFRKIQRGLEIRGTFGLSRVASLWLPLRHLEGAWFSRLLQPRKHHAMEFEQRFTLRDEFHFRGWKILEQPPRYLSFKHGALSHTVECKSQAGGLHCRVEWVVGSVSLPLDSALQRLLVLGTHGAK